MLMAFPGPAPKESIDGIVREAVERSHIWITGPGIDHGAAIITCSSMAEQIRTITAGATVRIRGEAVRAMMN